MSPADFANIVAHAAASDFLRLRVENVEGECIGVAVVEPNGLRIVVSLGRYVPTAIDSPPPPPKFTPMQRDIIEAAPSRLHNPISMKKIAKTSGYAYNSYFRAKVDELVEAGLLIRVGRGVRKAS